MKKTVFLLFVISTFLITSTNVVPQQNKEDQKFKKVLENYFDELWKFYPTAATTAGYHKYDDKLEDLDSGDIEKRHETLEKFNQELVAKVDRTKLSPEFEIDHLMMIDALDRELLNHESLVPWEYNPLFYNRILTNCIRPLLTQEFAPLETRAKNAAERLKNIPELIKDARENLKTPPQLHTETAINQFPAILDFYKNQLPPLIEQAPASSKPKLQQNLPKVISALESYQMFLKNELLGRSTGSVRLGEQAHRSLIRLTFQNTIPLQELIARSKADYKNLRREMFLVCIPFYKIMDPRIDLENPPPNLTEDQLINTTISHVLDKIKGEHAAPDEFINQIKASAQEIKAFLQEKQLVMLPEETLTIEPMPREIRGQGWARLLSPPQYETSGTFISQISPIPEQWEEEDINSFLHEYNNFLLYFWTVRRVYPGKFVPLFHNQKNPSLVRKMYPNKPLVKGWATFIEDMLPHSGFGNYDLRLRLNQLKLRLRAAIDFQLEFNIHEGGMTKEQAIAYMTRGGFQTKAEAERKWENIILNPGDAAYGYVGLQEITDMEKEYKKLKGESFSRKEFLDKILSYGAISLRSLKKKILEQ
ncbi:MAG: DUF885 domain-containing protein [Candidatus Aminicenantes bacterium]